MPRSSVDTPKLKVLDLFSCVGCHAIGMHAAGPFETVAFVENNEIRRKILAARFPGVPIFEDVTTYEGQHGSANIVMGGPPCQKTSVAAAIHGYRDGESLWPHQRRVSRAVGAEWVVVEQPPGHKAWETEVANDLCSDGYHCARVEFAASDCGAPYIRRRVYVLACTSLSRLEVAWQEVPQAIDRAKRSADARGAWNPDKLAALRVDARSAGEMDRSVSALRKERIEALGDSNPPVMMEVIGRAIAAAERKAA